MICQHEENITYGARLSETDTERVIAVTCDTCDASGWIREELISGDNSQIDEDWN